jgi:hypothetical protein
MKKTNNPKNSLSKYLLSLGTDELASIILSRADEDKFFKNELLTNKGRTQFMSKTNEQGFEETIVV